MSLRSSQPCGQSDAAPDTDAVCGTGWPRLLAGIAATALMVSSAIASPQSTLSLSRSIDVAAPVEKVWAAIGNFGDLSYFSAAVERTEIVKGKNNRIGAQRRIVMKDGGIILETLTARGENPYSLSYRMDEGKLPVSDYRSTISVVSSGKGSKVTWHGEFLSKVAIGTPDRPNGGKDAVDVMAGIYEGGLAAIKQAVER